MFGNISMETSLIFLLMYLRYKTSVQVHVKREAYYTLVSRNADRFKIHQKIVKIREFIGYHGNPVTMIALFLNNL